MENLDGVPGVCSVVLLPTRVPSASHKSWNTELLMVVVNWSRGRSEKRSALKVWGWPCAPSRSAPPPMLRSLYIRDYALIEELDSARYFLTVHDIVRFARGRGILCQGRGAAANSAVCYCLGMTAVDPTRVDMLFERFISRERDEPPDIDIDFEHERREEVMQYVYEKYGRERAALIAAVISYRGRSAIRDVGMVLGLSADLVQRLSADIDWWSDGIVDAERVRALGVDPEAPAIRRLFEIASGILGFPRHLSQHVGGFVIADRPLWEMVPVENAAMPDRTVIEWDKDDIDSLGLMKVDILALGMLHAIQRAMTMLREDHGLD